jgi:hypothetical protein
VSVRLLCLELIDFDGPGAIVSRLVGTEGTTPGLWPLVGRVDGNNDKKELRSTRCDARKTDGASGRRRLRLDREDWGMLFLSEGFQRGSLYTIGPLGGESAQLYCCPNSGPALMPPGGAFGSSRRSTANCHPH